MKASLIQFPWNKTERGQGFFVPCLDTQAIRTLGLGKAVALKLLDARAIPCIRGGFIGVWFYRTSLRTSAHS
jgi:hypothetical protein